MENELRRMFEIKETEMSLPPTLPPELRSRIGKHRMVLGGLCATAAAALVLGGFAVRSAVTTDAAPVPPADRQQLEIEPMRNGRILFGHAGDMYWLADTAPPAPSGDQSYHWDAFDQDTGSFLYAARSLEGRVWVVDEDRLVAELDCPLQSGCGDHEITTFGPDTDEITMPSADSASVHVIGLDGTLREEFDISDAALSPGQDLVDLAWSPDGNRLAVSTKPELSDEPERGCDPSTGPCGGRVWIFDRDGGAPRLVYSQSANGHTMLRDLEWSPDGATLALLEGSDGFLCTNREPWPRLVSLRMADEPVRAETLNVYDDVYAPSANECLLAHHFPLAFPFAWSPDGTRIAVGGGDEIKEISPESGEVLHRRPEKDVEGPLAWLPTRLTAP